MGADFRLGKWIIRPQRDCIERGGKTVRVQPKAMAVLECLARAGGNVVSRNELFDTVWPGSEVSDDSLTQRIVELRKALGDSARRPRVIETVPKIGFRLLVPVMPLNAESETDLRPPGLAGPLKPATRAFFYIVTVFLAALVLFWYLTGSRSIQQPVASGEIPSVAVLPFVDMSAGQDQGWYADGLTEDLINQLAQLEGLKVAGRTSSFKFKDRNEDLREIGDELGVNHVLEGSVRREADQLRITAQLIETKNGFHAWSRQFDRPREEIFAVQEEIATSVANALSIELQVGELGRTLGSTSSVEAYEEILLAKRFQWEDSPESLLLAIEHVKRATEIDPGYAQAWWHLAGMYVNAVTSLSTATSPDWLELSLQALDQARSLEPGIPGLVTMTAQIQMKQWQWPELEVTFDRGTGLDVSTDAEMLFAYGGFLARVGRQQEAIPLLERLSRLAPGSPGTAGALATMYAAQGRIEEGLAEAERAFGIEGFRQNSAYLGMAVALASDDRIVLLKWLQRAEEYGQPESRQLIRTITELLDDPPAALAYLRSLEYQTGIQDLLIAAWAAWHGDTELALGAMQRSTAPAAFWHHEMKEMRRTEAFKDLVRKTRLEAYFREFGWNDFCRPVGPDDFECE